MRRHPAPTFIVGSMIGVATFFAAAITYAADERAADFGDVSSFVACADNAPPVTHTGGQPTTKPANDPA